jgi:ABC-type multidrug transport system ATPase subunit
MSPVVHAAGLGKRYGKQWALKDIDLAIARGEILGFIGPNGAGKTTLLSLLCGLSRPSEGTIEIRPEVRIGLVSDQCGFISHLSGRRNLELLAQIQARRPAKGVDGCLEAVKLDPADRRPVEAYSLGMKQRLLIAQALLVEPDLLLLDEPTNGLDPDGIVLLRKLLAGLAEAGVAILLASHLLTEVERLCKRVLFVNHGKILREMDRSAEGPADLHVVFANRDDLERFRRHASYSILEATDGGEGGDGGERPRIRLAPEVDMLELLAFLVEQRIAVEEVARRRPSLEDAFLTLLRR